MTVGGSALLCSGVCGQKVSQNFYRAVSGVSRVRAAGARTSFSLDAKEGHAHVFNFARITRSP